jgi:magnesium-transporting ATPase (P-type)
LTYIGSFALADKIDVHRLNTTIEEITNDEKSSITVRILTADLLETSKTVALKTGIITQEMHDNEESTSNCITGYQFENSLRKLDI